ncbi:unnamed protein product [Acanthoscelides obtectus]|uniref:MADF domain-containing protein n=1 Tax=Acanthoscelides obtectus TaxID=200917 RepID=A0A9P0LMG5_ACAOB|nr:unnamed protein product [Acanthoscelides obtectus]CAK1658988.1 Transcription factor Adf-1 [Acanthoscelides obtectus]
MSFEENLILEVQARPLLWNKQNEHYKNRNKAHEEWEKITRSLGKPREVVKTKWRNLRDTFQKELKKITVHRSGDPGSPTLTNYTGKWVYFNDLWFLKDVMKPRETEGNCPEESQESEANSAEQDILPEGTRNAQTPSSQEHGTPFCESAPQFTETNCYITQPTDTVEIRQLFEQSSGTSSSQTLLASPPSQSRVTNVDTILRRNEKQPNKKRKPSPSVAVITGFQRQILEVEEKKIAAFKERSRMVDDEDMLFAKSLVPYLKTLHPIQKLRLKSKIQNLIADEMAASPVSDHNIVLSSHRFSEFQVSSDCIQPRDNLDNISRDASIPIKNASIAIVDDQTLYSI